MCSKYRRVLSAALSMAMIISMSSCSKKPKDNDNVNETTAAAPAVSETSVSSEKKAKKANSEVRYENILTGVKDISKSAVGKRPVAIMVNNLDASLPQYGISSADILFECPVEGGITRLMAIYGDYTTVPNVCSVRSCRYYFALFANSFDAVYLHWGIDKKVAENMLNKLNIDHIDGNVNETLFKRDEERLKNYDMEHSGYCEGSLIPSQIKSAGIRSKLSDEYKKSVFNFYDKQTAVSKVKCNELNVAFSEYYSAGFKYDTKTKVYKKIRNGEKHIDGADGKQLTYTNVIVLESKEIKVINEDNGLLSVDWKSGSGYLSSAGSIKRIKWKKSSELGKLVITDEKGNAVKLNKGKTYIGVTTAGNTSYS